MSKPIEWDETIREDITRHVRVVAIRTWTDRYNTPHREDKPPTPSDLASALAAMGEGERAEVLTMAAAQGVPGAITVRLAGSEEVIEKLKAERDDARLRCGSALATAATATARAEAAERERDRMAGEFGTCPGELPDDGEIARVVRERAEFRDRVERAERESAKKDEALSLVRSQREKAERERDEAVRRSTEHRSEEYRAWSKVAEANQENNDLRGRVSDLEVDVKAHQDRLRDVERERDEARTERDRSTHLRAGMLPDTRRELGALGCEDVAVAARRVVAERDRAQEERDKARAEQERLLRSNARYSAAADEAIRDRDAARLDLDRAQAALAVVRHDLEGTRRDLDDLRTRAIAAEDAIAQREPREYPLAEGSRFEGPCLVTAGKARVNIRPYLGDGPPTLSTELLDGSAYWLYLADVLALAHRRGLL